MLIFGNKYIPSPQFKAITKIEDIKSTTAKDILYLNELKAPYTIAKWCADNALKYAVKVESIQEALFANAFLATYIVCEETLAIQLQNIANEYLWDSKILAVISDDSNLETLAKASVDGVIYQNYIKD